MRAFICIGFALGCHFFFSQWGYPFGDFIRALHAAIIAAFAIIAFIVTGEISARWRRRVNRKPVS